MADKGNFWMLIAHPKSNKGGLLEFKCALQLLERSIDGRIGGIEVPVD